MSDLKESSFSRRDGSVIRRWFTNESIDLIVWYNLDGEISSFQLCYGKPRNERAITWKRAKGLSHHTVDAGEDNPMKNKTPILKNGASSDMDEVIRIFSEASGSIDKAVSKSVIQILQDHLAE
jgi:hypothetical protein